MVPAPLVIFVTFVGYLAAGLPGALVITAGMFLPAFSFGLILYDRLESIVENPRFHDMLQGIAAGVAGIIAATAIDLGGTLLQRLPLLWAGIAIFLLALVVLLAVKSRYTALWLIPLAGVAGWTLLR
jgi:chromate transporter